MAAAAIQANLEIPYPFGFLMTSIQNGGIKDCKREAGRMEILKAFRIAGALL